MCHTSSFSHEEAEETKVAKERKMLPSFVTEEKIAEKTLVKEPWGVFCAVK